LADRIAKALPAGGCRVLEVGCGEGGVVAYLRERRPDATCFGLDFSQEKVAFLSRHCPQTLPVCGDALSLPFETGTFDAVVYRDVLHHVNWAREQVLSEGLRVARHGGVVIVLESNGRTLLNRLFQMLYPAERGLRDSTWAGLMGMGTRMGRATVEYVEASFLVRAIGFVIGWPEGWAAWFVRPLYMCARFWEALVERLAPRSSWTYMMMCLRRS